MPGASSQSLIEDEEMNDTEISSSRGGMQSIGEISSRTIFKGTLKSNTKVITEIDEEDGDQDEDSSTQNESSSIYQIHKILSSDQYSIGASVQEYISSFHMQYKNLKESSDLLPAPMESC